MDKDYASIEKDVKNLKQFQKQGNERIKFHYPELSSNLEKDDRLKEVPHTILRKRAEKLLLLSLQEDRLSKFDRTELEIGDIVVDLPISGMSDAMPNQRDILLGVGTEILLKSITLKEDPQWFKNKGFEPHFGDCKDKICNFMETRAYSEEQINRVKEVLWLIQERRNNAVHLQFHHTENYRQPQQIYKVWKFLLTEFFEEPTKNMVKVLQKKEKQHEFSDGAIDYPEVNF